MNRIFIGWDKNIDHVVYETLRYSLLKHSSVPLEITPLVLDDIRAKHGFTRAHDPLQSTEFTYTRFLVPYLCGFQGVALFMDNDMLALGDVAELFALDMKPYWIRVVKHDYVSKVALKLDDKPQTNYPRKNWSSLMLLDCAKMACWTKEAVETKPARWLHRFEAVPDERIGDLPDTWNVLDRYDARTKHIHYTEGGPWYPQHKDHPYGDVWFRYRDEYLAQKRAARAA